MASSLASFESCLGVDCAASSSFFEVGVVDCSTMVSVEFVFEDESAAAV